MIISASRRTDIPAFYSQWLVNRLREGFCQVQNPFNPKQVATISLHPQEVEAIVFWTRHPRPLMPFLAELDSMGHRYYFLYTLIHYPRQLEPKRPSWEAAVRTFRDLSVQLGSGRVVWRYDPILVNALTPAPFHLQNFNKIAQALCGYTRRCIISLWDSYPRAARRIQKLGLADESDPSQTEGLLRNLAEIAHCYGMEVSSCAESQDFSSCGIYPGKCIDDALLSHEFGLEGTFTKDPGQRQACACVASKDIGSYDTCVFGCQYCYATSSPARSMGNYRRHNPSALSWMG